MGVRHLIDGRDHTGLSVRCDLPDARQPVPPHVSRHMQVLENIYVTAEESDRGRWREFN
jgi:hypothetical protein